MLPFDLTKALAAPDSVVYRNGEVPLEWHYFEETSESTCIISVCKTKKLLDHLLNGKLNDSLELGYDLFLKEPEMFVNADSEGKSTGRIYRSYEQAKGYLHDDERVFRLVEVTDK